MAKVADQYYKLDSWKIIEEGFEPNKNMVSESVFSLSNEYMGVRGYAEEGLSCQSLLGSYFNGVYENARELKNTSYKGIVKRTHYMINAVDWLYTRITLDGERLDTAADNITDFSRVLDMQDGTLKREFVWHTKSGKSLKISFLRFVSMERPTEGFQRIELEPVDFSGEIEMNVGLDFSTIHKSSNYCYWKEMKKKADGETASIMCKTLTTGIRIFSSFHLDCDRPFEKTLQSSDKYIGFNCVLSLKKSEKCTIDKSVTNIVEKDGSISDKALWTSEIAKNAERSDSKFDGALREQKNYWQNFWKNFDVQIDDDPKRQQGIHFCIFQLQQTYHGLNPANNIGAKGLTGEAYNGHTFWDTETYCLPFYLFNNPNAAKNLLEYRYYTLDNAKKRAKELDCKGACYPIATITGDEGCDLWQHASLQFQPSTGVAYGIMHYVGNTDDNEFLYSHGAEMLLEISRFLKSRGAWSQERHKFGFYAVMGPDEFHMMVNNNCYTNYMAKKTFEYTLTVIETMKGSDPDAYTNLQIKTGMVQAELDEIRNCAENMIIPYDEKTGIYEQHEGYFDLPHIDVNEIPVDDFPLYNNWSYDRIYRTDMIKQPDVLMMMFLFSHDFDEETKKKNYEYYEPRTIHESSLSPSIHSVLASELKKTDQAFDFFDFATRMDLDNYNRNTSEGLHTTSLAAAWINIVYGFGGMRSDSEMLKFAPSIPKQWKSYSFKITYKNVTICVEVSRSKVEIKALNAASVNVKVFGIEHEINQNGISIPLTD
jgi:maltose phosphorylase